MASWREAWRLSGAAYTELSFQTIYALRQGNLPPTTPSWDLVPRARRRVRQSKAVLSILLAMIAVGAEVLLRFGGSTVLGQGLNPILFQGGVLTGTIVLVMTFLWWTALQLVPVLIGSSPLALLETLPIPARTRDRVAFLVLFRLVDAPVVTTVILFPLAVAFGLGSGWAGVAMIPGIAAGILVALALALRTGRFFARRVQGTGGGRGRTLARWSFLALWTVPAFAMFVVITFALPFFNYLDNLVLTGQTAFLTFLVAIFPFPLALLPALTAAGIPAAHQVGFDPSVVVGMAAVYALALGLLGVWLVRATRRSLIGLPASRPAPRRDDTHIRPRSVSFAILRKDLRVASRTPTFAFLILLPVLNATAVGLYTMLSNPPGADAFNLATATVASAPLLATFFGPAFFAIEVIGYSYSRSLPLTQRSVIAGKLGLILLVYLVSSGIVFGLTLIKVFQPGVFFLFIAAELPAVVAAALLELGILYWVAQRRGLPIVNLYAGAWWGAIVTVPGVVFAGAPLLAFYLSRTGAPALALPGMAVLALAELTACSALFFTLPGKRPM